MSEPSSHPAARVTGKVALVTGAGSGIGRATATILAAEGAVVLCADINVAGAEETAARVTDVRATARPCQLDVTSEAAWQMTMEQIVSAHKRLDILVNCAGISFVAPIADMSLDAWRRVMAVNLESVFLGTKHAIRVMRQQEQGGSIVNVSSVSGTRPQSEASAYCTSKAAVLMFSKAAAVECLRAGYKVRINSVSPGGVKTPMWRTVPFFQELIAKEGSDEAAFRAMTSAFPCSRFALPDEVAQAILYLAADDFISGTDLVFDNGDTA